LLIGSTAKLTVWRIKMPVLQHIAGHRNREVYDYLELTQDIRDSRAAAIYSA